MERIGANADIGKRLSVGAAGLLAVMCAGCASGETGSPSQVSESHAAVEGRVGSDVGGAVEYWVQYGQSAAYGLETEHATVTLEPKVPVDVRVTMGGLFRGTLYHYRLCAQDSLQRGGPGCGADMTFTTQSFGCGEKVTADVRLSGNLNCYLGISTPGLIVGADGIDIDLGGFSLSGPGNTGGGPPAIDNSGGFDDLTVRNGSIGRFGDGIHVEGADRTRILNVSSVGRDGIDITGGEGHEIRRSEARGRAAGIIIQDAGGVTVADSEATGNGGIGLAEVDESRIVRNTVVGGDSPACCVTIGIGLWGDGNLMRDNRVGDYHRGNLLLAGGENNVLIGNEAFGGGLLVDPGELDTGGDGIFIGAATSGTLLRGNFAHDNAGDGIEVQSAGTRLADNRPTANGDLGIDAVGDVTDLGGNIASGNANPLECRNVFCR
jgi:Periplasmic copper-binding protein (NosD)